LSRRASRLFAVTILACGIAAADTIVVNGVNTNLGDYASTSGLPEPATLAMVGGALVALATLVRKRHLPKQDGPTGAAS
jgi:cytochrome c-type biogenesis protein CcmE